MRGRRATSPGVPSCTDTPSSRTSTRSASTIASSGSWVTSTVAPEKAVSRQRSIARTDIRVSASNAAIGSSSSKSRGRVANARASATRCCWPPESVRGRAARVLGHPHVGEQVEREPAGLPRGHALAARAECHVLHHGQVGEQEKVLEHETDRAPLRGHGQQVDPVHPQVSLRGEQPGQGAQHRGLSRTVRAEQRQHVAGRHLEAGFHGETGMVDDQVGVHDGDGRGHRAPSQWSRSTTRMRTETASSTRLSTTAASGLRCISKYTASGIVWVRPG